MARRRAAVILAAGASERMGTPKALLPWGNTTLLEHALQTARAADAAEVVVVLGPVTGHLEPLGVRRAFNPRPETGRSESIRLGASELPADVGAILVQSVDQPSTAEVLSALFDAVENGAQVAIPTHEGRRGHPICLSGDLLAEIRDLTEEREGLRAVVRRHHSHVVEVPVTTESVLWNLNDPEAYAAARAAAGLPLT